MRIAEALSVLFFITNDPTINRASTRTVVAGSVSAASGVARSEVWV
jgi:hypothetical protein